MRQKETLPRTLLILGETYPPCPNQTLADLGTLAIEAEERPRGDINEPPGSILSIAALKTLKTLFGVAFGLVPVFSINGQMALMWQALRTRSVPWRPRNLATPPPLVEWPTHTDVLEVEFLEESV